MTEPAIELIDCSYSYDGQVPALRGVSCSVEAGSWVALVGPNGSGKSTLAKLCNGLLRPQQGRVLIQGRNIHGRPVGEMAREVGYLFQNPDHQIFASSVSEEVAFGLRNLGFGDAEVARRVEEALALFELTEHAERPPALLGDGLRRQVALASAFAHRPAILVLDEPTGGLDWERTGRLLHYLDDQRRAGRTILFITHDLRVVADRATHVLLLLDGDVLAAGRTRDVLSSPDVLARAAISPPPITQLSQRLQPCGMAGDSMTVEAFYREYVGLLAERGVTRR